MTRAGNHILVVQVLRSDPAKDINRSSKRSNTAMSPPDDDNVVVSYIHHFNVIAAPPVSMEATWNLPLSSSSSSSTPSSQLPITVRFGEPLPTLCLKLADEYKNKLTR